LVPVVAGGQPDLLGRALGHEPAAVVPFLGGASAFSGKIKGTGATLVLKVQAVAQVRVSEAEATLGRKLM
jgi:hypothetical protein